MNKQVLFLLFIAVPLVAGGNLQLTENKELISTQRDGTVKSFGVIGIDLDDVGMDCASETGSDFCRRWGYVTFEADEADFCLTATMSTEDLNGTLTTCFNMTGHWYGGPEQYNQYWPVEKEKLLDYSYITKSQDNQGIAEPYWLTSSGDYFYVNPITPLFIDQNNRYPGMLCMIAKNVAPYSDHRDKLVLSYRQCSRGNARLAHQDAVKSVLGKPSAVPDERMIRHPIWSTWARYKVNINEEVVTKFADEILENGFKNSQLEIDDFWETCYGSLTFDISKFPNIKNLTDNLKSKGFRVTLWIHPFINSNCEPYHSEALSKGYFVNSTSGTTLTTWWNGIASIIDFTNPDAVTWWTDRLKTLQKEAGIDSFKFDAGETSWLPQVPVLSSSLDLQPGIFTSMYVETVSQFGPMIEIRVGQRTQHVPNFVRMLDKDTKWDFRNGLRTLVTTLLQMNMVGYTIVLPDMVGGNAYGDKLTKELFIRWLQANVFMPAIQYSFTPWDFDQETIEISKKYTELHANYSDKIIAAIQKSVDDGSPVNPPIWWIDPEDTEAQAVDDEFLLGEDILVAPVIEEGAVTRDIYLPAGNWSDQLHPDSPLISGRTWLRNYSAALDELPYFVRLQ